MATFMTQNWVETHGRLMDGVSPTCRPFFQNGNLNCDPVWVLAIDIAPILIYPHPGKLTWNLKITCLTRKIIFQPSIFGGSMLIFRGVYNVYCPEKTNRVGWNIQQFEDSYLLLEKVDFPACHVSLLERF